MNAAIAHIISLQSETARIASAWGVNMNALASSAGDAGKTEAAEILPGSPAGITPVDASPIPLPEPPEGV